jgi:hypothetical protein
MGGASGDITIFEIGFFFILVGIPTMLITYGLDYFYPSGVKSGILFCEALLAGVIVTATFAFWFTLQIRG